MDVIHRNTPVALFTYNRPDHVGRALASLARCHRLEDCRLHLYCDGAKGEHDRAAVEASRRVVRERGVQLHADIVERRENLGLARSIVSGVSELCERFGRVIVLEDDMQVSPDFLDYMIQSLDRYEFDVNVYQISGFMFPVDLSGDRDACFLPLTTTWGWATWARAWQSFDWNATGAREQLADPDVRHRFDLDGSYPYARMLESRLTGKNSSWGILWWWAVFQAKGLVLHPRTTLVWMDGFDGTGTHCGQGVIQQVSLESMKAPRLSFPIKFPEWVAVNLHAFEAVKAFLLQGSEALKPSMVQQMWRRLTRYVSAG